MHRSRRRSASTGRGKPRLERMAVRMVAGLVLFGPACLSMADSPARPAYQTGFEGYRSFDPGVMTLPWRQAVDAVGRVGGLTGDAEGSHESKRPQPTDAHSEHRQ